MINTNPFEKRYLNPKITTWYIGENMNGISIVRESMDSFYKNLVELVETSENVRAIK